MSSTKYRVIRCETDFDYRKYRIQPKTLEELKEQIADAFYKGVKWVRLYCDGRKMNSFLEIRKEQFDETFIEESFIKLQLQNKIDANIKRIASLNSNIEWNKNRIGKQSVKN